jgi:rhomboid protease GluP
MAASDLARALRHLKGDTPMIAIAVLALLGFGLYVMTPAERERLARSALALVVWVKDANGTGRAACEPFAEALRARTPWTVVTAVLVALNVSIFAWVWLSGPTVEAGALIEWGANAGPRTTNWEWWRLLTALFVHGSVVALIVNVAALVQLGLLLERLVGHVGFACAYFAAGLIAGLAQIAIDPVAVSAGASGPIFGLYGLLVASVVWSARHQAAVTIWRPALLRLAPSAALFAVYNLFNGSVQIGAELAALAAGLAGGVVLARGIGEHTPSLRQVAVASAATLAIVVVSAVPLRGLADVRPVLSHITSMEDQTSDAYNAAVARFRNGMVTAPVLVRLIDRDIVPQLQAAREQLGSLGRVPEEHQPLVASAEEYLRLREESWSLRSEALRKGSMAGLHAADRAQRDALAAFHQIRPAESETAAAESPDGEAGGR